MLWKTEFSPLLKDFELKHQPVIIRVNKFDEKAAQDFNNKMAAAQSTGQKVVPVIIDSYGGQVYSLMSMISAIKSSEIPVATIVEGKAMSCGAVLLSFGEQGMRFADPDATVMIHDVSSGGYGKIEELKADVKEAERLDDVELVRDLALRLLVVWMLTSNDRVYKCGFNPDSAEPQYAHLF